jgi:hypothetical protein
LFLLLYVDFFQFLLWVFFPAAGPLGLMQAACDVAFGFFILNLCCQRFKWKNIFPDKTFFLIKYTNKFYFMIILWEKSQKIQWKLWKKN